MLNITIERFATYHDAVNGRLSIEGAHVCDTLEHKEYCLPDGRYPFKLKDHCLPRLKACNGPYGLKDGSISVGECHHIGFLIHCTEPFSQLCHRIRKVEKRGGEVWIEIKTRYR